MGLSSISTNSFWISLNYQKMSPLTGLGKRMYLNLLPNEAIWVRANAG
jgi:hypothetical protein